MSESKALRIAILGAGAIGQRHAEVISRSCNRAMVAAICDPSEASRAFAAQLGVAHFRDLGELLANARPDAVIDASPTPFHVANAMVCIRERIALLIEKPVAISDSEANTLVTAVEASDVPVLVGHHRRHSAAVAQAKRIIDSGCLGEITAVQCMTTFMKPDSYFEPDWRRGVGAGPILTNLVHDIDLLRHLCGEIEDVQAIVSNTRRGFQIEDTGGVLLRFQNGAIGTALVSDSATSPRSWELTAAENPDYPCTGESCYQIIGTDGTLDVPTLKTWSTHGSRDWRAPMGMQIDTVLQIDPLDAQLTHFVDVVRGIASPLVTVREGARTLAVINAIKSVATVATVSKPFTPLEREHA